MMIKVKLKLFQNVAFTLELLGENTTLFSKGDFCPQ